MCQRNCEPRCRHGQGSKKVMVQTRLSLFLLGWIWGRAWMVQIGRVREGEEFRRGEQSKRLNPERGQRSKRGEQVQSDGGRRAEQA